MKKESEMLQFLHFHPKSSRNEIAEGLNLTESPATLKRMLASLVERGDVSVVGQGRATSYSISAKAQVTMPIDIDTYFLK